MHFKPENWNINEAIEGIEDTLNKYCQEFEKTTVDSILEYQYNLKYVDINEENKMTSQQVIKDKKLPDQLSKKLIQDINELFK